MDTSKRKETSQTRKDYIMAIITRKEAIKTAMTYLPSDKTAIREVLEKMVGQLEKSHAPSDEARAKANEKRRTENEQKRKAMLAVVAPIIRKGITTAPRTAQEIYDAVASDLPSDVSVYKVRHILTYQEAGTDIIEDKNGKNPNTYHF